METFRAAFCENKGLPNTILLQVKERKAKIRKFMLYVNGILNETEQDIQMMCEVFSQLERLLEEAQSPPKSVPRLNDKKKRRVKFTAKVSTTPKTVNDALIVPETAPYSTKESLEPQEHPIVQETCPANDSLLSPKESVQKEHEVVCSRNLPMQLSKSDDLLGPDNQQDDETLGIFVDENVQQPHVKSKVKCRGDVVCSASSYNMETVSEQASKNSNLPLPNELDSHMESCFLSPVTSLLNNVMGVTAKIRSSVRSSKPASQVMHAEIVNNCRQVETTVEEQAGQAEETRVGKGDGKRASAAITAARNVPIKKTCANYVDVTESPALFDDNDNEETMFDTDVTEVPAVDQNSPDITVTKQPKKTVTCWPIGYPKTSSRGQLVVEPVDQVKSRKRVRQTRLDGFLAKAAFHNSMDCSSREPIIVMKSIRKSGSQSSCASAQPAVKPLAVHDSGSDSDDLCDIDLGVLQGKGENKSLSLTDKPSIKTSTDGLNQSLDCDRLPVKRSKYEIGEVVRGKARKNLTGYQCKQCYEYYCSLKLSKEEIQERLNQVCRHRAVKPPMETPPSFWNMSIASLEPT